MQKKFGIPYEKLHIERALKRKTFASLIMHCSICIIVAALCLIAAQHAGAENLQQKRSATVSATAHAVEQQTITPEYLVGRWNRSDGDYAIEISQVKGSTELNAAYYNPKPIHIAQTKITFHNGEIKIFIELRDTGYPGSAYTLDYLPSDDVLKGTYFHAGLQQDFQVSFTKEKKQAQ